MIDGAEPEASSLSAGTASAQDIRHFDALDSLRGICAILVLLFHFHVQSLIYSIPIVRCGWIFVDFFFVLSGFVIAHTYADRLAQGRVTLVRFMALRMGRIYPLHLFMLAVLIALEVLRSVALGSHRATFDDGHSIPSIATNLMLLQSMGVHQGLTWNGVSWSIAAEMWAYLLFGVLFVAWPRHALKAFGAVGVLSLLVLLLASSHGLDATYDYGYLRGLMGFAIGIGVRAAFGAGLRPSGTLAEWAIVIAVLLLAPLMQVGRAAFLMLPVFGMAVLVFASQGGALSRMMCTRVPLFLGRISYSIYMTHILAQIVAFEALRRYGEGLGFFFGAGPGGDEIAARPGLGDIAVLLMLALAIAVAAGTYRWVELPARDWVRSRLDRRRRAAAAAV